MTDLVTVTGHGRIAGVIGWPVAHSQSPRLHGFWLRRYGVDGAYVPLAVDPTHVEEAIRALPYLGFRGSNVTVPHKETAFRLSDRLTERARRIGAVNTLIVEPDGTLLGDCTDGYGFIENLKAGASGWQGPAGPAVVIGAGGAARAVIVALLDAGVPEIRLSNRTRERAERLAREFGPAVTVVDWDHRASALADAAVVVNTTTQGMQGHPALDLSLDRLPESAVVTDIVYTPLETPLLAAARAHGCVTVDGLGMLLHQARPGFAAWFGVEPEVDDALRAHVLAGMKRAL